MKISKGEIKSISVNVEGGQAIDITDLSEADYEVFIKGMQQLIVLYLAAGR